MNPKTIIYDHVRKKLVVIYESGRKATFFGDLAYKMYIRLTN